MRDSNIIKFFRVFGALRNLALSQIRERLDRLTPKQRILLVGGLFILFLIVDIIYIVQGFIGGHSTSIEIEHIREIPIDGYQPDSINLPNFHDYER